MLQRHQLLNEMFVGSSSAGVLWRAHHSALIERGRFAFIPVAPPRNRAAILSASFG